MKYIRQLLIILFISFIGELLNRFLPLPVPASIYGLVILFLCLYFKIIKLEDVQSTGEYLIEIMSLMFLPASIALLDSMEQVKALLIPAVLIITVVTLIVMVVTGVITQAILDKGGKK